MKNELLVKLKDLVESGTKKTKLEEEIGLPTNSLSAVLNGVKEMPDKWVGKIEEYLKITTADSGYKPKNVVNENKSLSEIKNPFRSALIEFNKIIEGKDETSKLTTLKDDCVNNVCLNSRQREAIIERCNNYINGTYGKTKDGVIFKSVIS